MHQTAHEPFSQHSKDYGQMGLALLAMALLTVGLQLLMILAGVRLSSSHPALLSNPWFKWLAAFLPLYLFGFPTAFLLMRKVPADPPARSKLGAGRFLSFLLMCFPLMYGGNLIGTLLSNVLSGGTAQNNLEAFVFDSSPLKLLVIVILAPLAEEFLYRKQLIDRCRNYGEKTVILFSSLSFALFHMNFFQFFYAFGLGAVFAYLYTRTGLLRYSIALHMIINFIGSVIAPLLLSSVDLEALQEALQEINFSGAEEAILPLLPQFLGILLFSLAILLLSAAGLVLLILKAPKMVFLPSPEELPYGQGWKALLRSPWVILFFLFCSAVCIYQLF